MNPANDRRPRPMNVPPTTRRTPDRPLPSPGRALALALALLLPGSAGAQQGAKAVPMTPAVRLAPAAPAQGGGTSVTIQGPALTLRPASPAAPSAPVGGAPDPQDEQALALPEDPEAAAREAALRTELESTVDRAVSDGAADRAEADALFVASTLAFGDPTPALELLSARGQDEGRTTVERRAAHLLAGWARWRFGDLEPALADFDAALALDEGHVAGRLQRARLLDALGRSEEALEAYEALLPELQQDPALAEDLDEVRLRIALMAMEIGGEEGRAALAEHARASDAELRNRAAVVLALLERPAEAIELFQVREDEKAVALDELRVAEWALRAGEAVQAQDAAWRAYRTARLGRDRRYALALLVEAHRADESLDALCERFAATDDLEPDGRRTWIEVLREAGRHGEAIQLFRDSAAGESGELPDETRRALLELYREAGREEEMVAAYREQIRIHPESVLWREGLSRHLLEQGDREAALAVWDEGLEGRSAGARLEWAHALRELGLYDRAEELAEGCVGDESTRVAAQLFLFALARDLGDLPRAQEVLERLDASSEPGAPERLDLAESWEQIGQLARAAEVLEGVKASRPAGEAGEDLEMRLAWLYSEIGEEDRALEAWHELWLRVNSVPRRRYVEDRLMTVASRLGKLADVAIELEQKLYAGEANERESGLLVRLYTKVGDGVSATEVVEEFFRSTGRAEVDVLQEKARVFLATNDYSAYEELVQQLIVLDPEGEGEYLQQLAMSMLERGKPDQARVVLERMKGLESDLASAEFEAGVLALGGLRDEAVASYRKGLAAHPERIDGYLLMADLLKQTGDADRAVGMFQYLAEHAERDDLFMIAVDGFLNMLVDAAPRPRTVAWARRVTLERLAGRHDQSYLYQLLSDLAEEGQDREGMLIALENSLASAGSRRASVLRELMDLARGQGDSFTGRGWEGDEAKHLAYGRRLVGTRELVPPQVYLDLGEAFLKAGDAEQAARTFDLTRDLPEHATFQRRAAVLFEEAGKVEQALDTYRALLATSPTDVALLIKVAELEESLGHDGEAHGLYVRAVDLLLSRESLTVTKAEDGQADDPYRWYAARNVDDWDRYSRRAITGELASADAAQLAARREALLRGVRADLLELTARRAEGEPDEDEADLLARHPRLERRAGIVRRSSLAGGVLDTALALDRELLAAFPDDEQLLSRLVRTRLARGLYGSARDLIAASERPEDQTRPLLALLGDAPATSGLARSVPLAEAVRGVLPLLAGGDAEGARELLLRTDFNGAESKDLLDITALFSAARYLGDEGLMLRVGRQWVRLQMQDSASSYQLEPVLQTIGRALSEDNRKALFHDFVGRVLNDTEKHAALMPVIPTLQREVEEPLASEEQLLDLFDQYGERGAWQLGPVLSLLPAESRAGALRGVWSKIAKTNQNYMLLNLVGEFPEEMSDELKDFLDDAFKASLEEPDPNLQYWVSNLSDARHNADLVLRMARSLGKQMGEDAALLCLEATKLLELERTEEAREVAGRAYLATLNNEDGDWRVTNAQRELLEAFGTEGRALFADALAAHVAEVGPSVELALARITLLEGQEDEAPLDEAVAAALEAFPEERQVLQRARRHALQRGDRLGGIELQQRLMDLDAQEGAEPDDKARRQALMGLSGSWRGLRQFARALEPREAAEAIELEEEDDAGGGGGIPGLPANFVLPAGARIVVNGVMYVGGQTSANSLPRDIGHVKESLEAGETEEARETLRRMWRQFQTGLGGQDDRFGFYGSSPLANLRWPVDPDDAQEDEDEDAEGGDEAEPEEPKVHRGGLDGWQDEVEVRKVERPDAYAVLAEQPFAVEEFRRFLFTRESRELDGLQKVVEGLALALEHERGEAGAVEHLLAELEQGRAGRVEQVQLLALLDRHPERVDASVRDALSDLVRSVNPKDAVQVRRLARVRARSGAIEEAGRLYRWCATRCTAEPIFYGFGQDEGTRVTASELVEEAGEVLEGDARIDLVQAVLEYAEPGDSPWERESFGVLVISTWEDMLGPEAALERARPVCEGSIDLSRGLQRRVAARAAPLFARAGELEHAVRAVEVAYAALDPEEVAQPAERWYRVNPEQPGFLRHEDVRRLMPLDAEGWADPAGWYAALGTALEAWLAEERMRVEPTVQALCVLALREAAAGDEAGARARVARLAERTDLAPDLRLWIADAAERVGAPEVAQALERDLLLAGRLHVERMADALVRLREAEGAARALEVGAAAAESVRPLAFLEEVRRSAVEAGDAEAAAHWAEVLATETAAKARLEELDEAARLAAEARKAAREAREAEESPAGG